MNYLRRIASIALLLLLTYCANQGSEKSRDRDYTSAELIGKWTQVNTDKSLNDKNPKIEFIKLLIDSVAEVQILDSTGVRKIFGKWENGFKKENKSLDIKFESDIKISFLLADNQSYILLLRLGEENKKTIMTAYNYKFKKE